ncbi:MAG: hypothetical protein U0271_09325 [Polyangiaceae bacterium]
MRSLVQRALSLTIALVAVGSTAASHVSAAPSKQADAEARAKLEADAERALEDTSEASRAAALDYVKDFSALASVDDAMLEEMISTVSRLRALHCSDTANPPALCPTLARAELDGRRLRAQVIIERADRGGDEVSVRKDYERAATMYRDLAESAEESKNPRRPELYYNAVKAFQAARLIDTALETVKLAIAADPKFESPITRELVLRSGHMNRSLTRYESAAAAYEEFASKFPKEDGAPTALFDAVVMRLALAEFDLASADGDLFLKLFASHTGEAATVAYGLAAYANDPSHAIGAKSANKWLTQAVNLSSAAPLDARLEARVLGAHDLAARGKLAEARKLMSEVANGMPLVAKMASELEVRALGRALTAIGEATFQVAMWDDAKRPHAKLPRPPALKGAAQAALTNKEDAYLVDALVPSYKARVAEIDALEHDLGAIMQLQPEPPPKWVLRASGTVALARIALAEELRALAASTSPKRVELVKRIGELRDAALTAAKASGSTYISLGAKFQGTSEERAAVEQFLTDGWPKEFPVLSELMPAATFLPAGSSLPAPSADRKQPEKTAATARSDGR